MKYVRTERGIYKLSDYKKIEDGWLYFVVDGVKTNIYGKVISQADTIDKLCDEFVVIRKGTKPHTAGVPYFKIKMDSKYINEKGYEIRGAIWTDKGLIYVAKMNEKGELELL